MSEVRIDLYPFLLVKDGDDLLSRISVSYNWVPKEHQRRLQAYTVLAAYVANLSNAVRNHPEDDGKLHEYGDANWVCTAMMTALLGDTFKVIAPQNEAIEQWYKQWTDREEFYAKVVANEFKASVLGDCLYRLSYSRTKGRTRIQTLDPGFWFPFDLGGRDERHVIAWEEKNEKTGDIEVYREDYTRAKGADGREGSINLTAAYYSKGSAERVEKLTRIRIATNDDGEELDNYNLGIDFFPLVWIPNIYREGQEFGESDLTAVLRILDDLMNTYTDEGHNAYIMGKVQMWMRAEELRGLPADKSGNRVIDTSGSYVIPGEAGIVDNSTLNKALIEYQRELERKLLDNTMLGVMSTGHVQGGSGDRTTGIFQVKGGPLERFIGMKRLIRQSKYNRLLRMVARFENLNGEKAFRQRGKLLVDEATLQFGNILPIDQTALLENLAPYQARLTNNDLKDNLLEAGLKVKEEIQDLPEPQPAQRTTTRPQA